MHGTLRRLALGFPLRWSHRRLASFAAVSGGVRAPYYIEWDPGAGIYGESWTTGPFDAQGTLLTGPGRVYHPIRIAQFALHSFGAWHASGSPRARDAFLAQARWLRDAQDHSGCYRFAFAWRKYGASAGWISAMAQGEAISVLLRANELYPSDGFLDAAFNAARPFRSTIEQGGVTWSDGSDVFFEEIANVHAPHVLNGCIYALWGLYELRAAENEPWQRELVERCVATLRRWLPRYDTGYWSLYSLMRDARGAPHLATLKYHAFHVAQLEVLAAMFDDDAFAATAARWRAYIDRAESRRRLYADTLAALPGRLLQHDTVAGGART